VIPRFLIYQSQEVADLKNHYKMPPNLKKLQLLKKTLKPKYEMALRE
jgi:hypothetical protein